MAPGLVQRCASCHMLQWPAMAASATLEIREDLAHSRWSNPVMFFVRSFLVRRFFVRSLLVVASLLPLSVASAEAADLDRIEAVLADFDRLDLNFEQYVHGAEGELVEFATGRFIMQRPKFRWVVDDPYPQVIVSNGDWLKIYDPDLEQVTERSLAEALEGTPLGILSRKDGRIGDQFDVLTHDVEKGADYYMLVPSRPDSKTQRVEIWLKGQSIERLDVTDESGGRLRLQFKSSKGAAENAKWTSNPWVLEVPPGTEVIQG
jgi:outer membrane lipoprotein carrier protein